MDEEQVFLAGLVAAANAVAVARVRGDPAMIARLTVRLAGVETTLRAGGRAREIEAAEYVAVLRAALDGEDVARLAARLADPFDRIVAELAETLADAASESGTART